MFRCGKSEDESGRRKSLHTPGKDGKLFRRCQFRAEALMIPSMMCSILTLILIGWVLCTNSNDGKTFERELEEEFGDISDERR